MARRLRDDEPFVPAARPRRAAAEERKPAPKTKAKPKPSAAGKPALDACLYLTAGVSQALPTHDFWVARYDSPDDGYCLYHSLRTLLLTVPWTEESRPVAADVLRTTPALRTWLLNSCPSDVLYMAVAAAEVAPRAKVHAKRLDAALAEPDRDSPAWLERHAAMLRTYLGGDPQGDVWTSVTLSLMVPEIALVIVDRSGVVDDAAGSRALAEKRERLAATYPFPLDPVPDEFGADWPGCTREHPATLFCYVQGKEIVFRGEAASLSIFDQADYTRAVLQQRGLVPSAVMFVERNGVGVHHYQPLLLDGSIVAGRPISIGTVDPDERDERLAIRPGRDAGDRYFLYRDTAPARLLSALQFEVARADPAGHRFTILTKERVAEARGRAADLAARVVAGPPPSKYWMRAVTLGDSNLYPYVARRISDCHAGDDGRSVRVWRLKPLSLWVPAADAFVKLFGGEHRVWGGMGSFAAAPGGAGAGAGDGRFTPGAVPHALALLYGGGLDPGAALERFLRSVCPIDCYSLPELRMRYSDAGYAQGTFPHCDPAIIARMVDDWTFSPALLTIALRGTAQTAVALISHTGELRLLVSPDVRPVDAKRHVKRVFVVYVLDRGERGVCECALVCGVDRGRVITDPFDPRLPRTPVRDAIRGVLEIAMRYAACVRDPDAGGDPRLPSTGPDGRWLPGADALRAGDGPGAERAVVAALESLLARTVPRSCELRDQSGKPDGSQRCSTLYKCANKAPDRVFLFTDTTDVRRADADIVRHIVADTRRILSGTPAPPPPAGWREDAFVPGRHGACAHLAGDRAVFGEGGGGVAGQADRLLAAAHTVRHTTPRPRDTLSPEALPLARWPTTHEPPRPDAWARSPPRAPAAPVPYAHVVPDSPPPRQPSPPPPRRPSPPPPRQPSPPPPPRARSPSPQRDAFAWPPAGAGAERAATADAILRVQQALSEQRDPSGDDLARLGLALPYAEGKRRTDDVGGFFEDLLMASLTEDPVAGLRAALPATPPPAREPAAGQTPAQQQDAIRRLEAALDRRAQTMAEAMQALPLARELGVGDLYCDRLARAREVYGDDEPIKRLYGLVMEGFKQGLRLPGGLREMQEESRALAASSSPCDAAAGKRRRDRDEPDRSVRSRRGWGCGWGDYA